MGLEDAYNTFAGIEEADSLDGAFYLLGVVGIVINVDEFLFADTIVETATHTGEGLEFVTQLVLIESTGKGNGRGGDGILDIDERRPVEFKVVEHTIGGTEVEEEVATVVADIDSVVVGIDASGGIGAYLGE